MPIILKLLPLLNTFNKAKKESHLLKDKILSTQAFFSSINSLRKGIISKQFLTISLM